MSRIESEPGKIQQGVEGNAATRDINRAADATVMTLLKHLVPEKARHALRLSVQKSALTAAGLYLLVSSGCGNVESETVNPPSIKELTPASDTLLSTPESQKPQDYDYISFENIIVTIDKEGLPVEYVLPDGKKVSFDKELVKKLRKKAISSKEPEIISLIEDTGRTSKSKDELSRERPKVSELPKDILSEEELAKRGINIVQADNTNLYLREGAFAEGNPLAVFNSGDRKLTIVLVNGPFLADEFMKDARYDSVKEFFDPQRRPLSSEPTLNTSYNSKRIASLEKELSLYRKKVKQGQKLSRPDDQNKLGNYKSKIYELKSDLYAHTNNMLSNEELFELRALEKGTGCGFYHQGLAYGIEGSILRDGERISDYHSTRDPSQDREVVIFLAVRGNPFTNKRVLAFNEEGVLISNPMNITLPPYYHDLAPKAEHSNPNPKDFLLNTKASPDEPTSYPYQVHTSGQILRHELEHDKLITQRTVRGEVLNMSEYDTDMRAMEGIKEAWEKWEKSGFKDNSGYYFVFSLPPEEGGGYILTKNKQPNTKTPSGT